MEMTLYSFGKYDRSGKVRWTAYELGYTICEETVEVGAHGQLPYTDINPYGLIPAAKIDAEIYRESSAICRVLADRHAEALLVPSFPQERKLFHQLCAAATESLEPLLTPYYLDHAGIAYNGFKRIFHDALKHRVSIFCANLPDGGFLVGDGLTLADIFAGYVIRLAVQAELIAFDQVGHYMEPLMQRDAARKAEIFASLRS